MRNSKKFKFLGKFFSAKKLGPYRSACRPYPSSWPHRGGTPATSRVSRASLPVTCHSRKTPVNVPSDDFEQRMPTHPSPPRQTSACRCRGSPRPENAPRRRFVRFHSPLSHQPRPRPCARPSTIVTSTPLRSAVHRCTSRPARGTVIVGL